MREAQSWVQKIFGRERGDVLALINPEVVRHRGPITRFLVGGATLVGILSATLVGASALVALMFAIGVVYFLATQVLGLKVDVDPQALYQQFQQRTARTYGAN